MTLSPEATAAMRSLARQDECGYALPGGGVVFVVNSPKMPGIYQVCWSSRVSERDAGKPWIFSQFDSGGDRIVLVEVTGGVHRELCEKEISEKTDFISTVLLEAQRAQE